MDVFSIASIVKEISTCGYQKIEMCAVHTLPDCLLGNGNRTIVFVAHNILEVQAVNEDEENNHLQN